ncbi:hypothetical protein KL938_001534 [Ogataea parapolymorpha]|nr:hypothetical protein KL938_001534 [Ogataea parapolymorpha]
MTKTVLFHAVINCDFQNQRQLDRGDYGDIACIFFTKHGLNRPTKKYHAVSGDLPSTSELDKFGSIHLTGANQCPYGDEPWVLELVALVKNVVENYPSIKLTGACFGHQIICRATGGVVTPNPNGIEGGICEIEISDEFPRTFLDLPTPGKLYVVEAHKNWVQSAPPDVIVLGFSSKTHNQGVYRKGRFLTIQGHPEYGTDVSDFIVQSWIKKDCSQNYYADCVSRNKTLPNDGGVFGRAMVRFLTDDSL